MATTSGIRYDTTSAADAAAAAATAPHAERPAGLDGAGAPRRAALPAGRRSGRGRRWRLALPPLAVGLLLALSAAAQPPGEPMPEPPPYGAPQPPDAGQPPQGGDEMGAPQGGYQMPPGPQGGYPMGAPEGAGAGPEGTMPGGGPDQGAAGPEAAAETPDGGSASYLRLVEGSATVTHPASGTPPASGADSGAATVAAQVNQPIMPGDSIAVAPHGRVEIMLADNNIVRLDGDTRLTFDHLANSAGLADAATELRLDEGNLQLIVTQNSIGQEMPTVLTPNLSAYIQAYGNYRITTDRGDFSEVLVRRGTAQLVSDAGQGMVRAGEEARVDSRRQARIDVREAGAYDSLERWAGRADTQARVAASSYVDPSLAYQAASLDRYGHWIDYQNQSYWQPNEEDSGWSPYWDGRWETGPGGLTWVANEPWGWVPYHYGTWDYLPSYGWAWQPGAVYSPAWVYWYWGPSYVGWCPAGFYTGFYGGFFPSFRFGLYGWAGGDWGLFAHWHFSPFGHFFHADWHRWAIGGAFGRGLPGRGLERGLITTSTRGLSAHALLHGNAGSAMRILAARGGAGLGRGGRALPDVSSFVGRQAHLAPEVARAVRAPGGVGAGRLAGTPFAPRTLGTRQELAARGGSAGAGRPGTAWRQGAGGNAYRPGEPGRPGFAGPGRGGAESGRPQPARPQGERPGAAQHYPAHPAPAQPRGQVPHGQVGTSGRYQSSPRYGASPGYGSNPSFRSAPGSQSTPGYRSGAPGNRSTPGYGSPGSQSAPGYRSNQGYSSAPPASRYQAAPRYQSAPSYQSAPRYQSAPSYRSAPHSQSAPRYQSAPRAQSAPRSQSSSHGSSGGSHHGGGGSGHQHHGG